MKIKMTFLFIAAALMVSCSTFRSEFDQGIVKNTKKNLKKPYVILISLDGFRWDYVERFQPPNLTNFINNGVEAESLISCYPTKTFPNHYSIATGMYPDTHGLVGNTFWHVQNQSVYKIRDRQKVQDGSFYGGTPIWVNASRQGMVTASFFFVGSEAKIQGVRPTYFYNYDGKITNAERVKQTLKWLQLPESKRPHLITLYFSDMDDVGHRYGPNNDKEINKKLQQLDKELGILFDNVNQLNLPVNFIIVSDHGMKELQTKDLLPIESIANKDLYLTMNNGAIVNIHPRDKKHTDSIFTLLKSKEKHFKVYRTGDVPHFDRQSTHENWGPIQVVADHPYYFTSQTDINNRIHSKRNISGGHGFPPKVKDMHAIFYANGPQFKKGLKIPSFKNIHVYPLICKILGLEIPKEIDGNLNPTKQALK